MIDPVREAAVRLLLDVEKKIPLTGPMDVALGRLDPESRPRFRSLVTETIRHRARIDHVLDGFLSRGPVGSLHPPIRQILRLASAEHLVLRSTARHAIVHTWVEIARQYGHKGTTGLCNAILRRVVEKGTPKWNAVARSAQAAEAALIAETAGTVDGGTAPALDVTSPKVKELADRWALLHSHPAWLIQGWLGFWGVERVGRILEWNQSTPDYWIRIAPAVTEAPAEGTAQGSAEGTAQGSAEGTAHGSADVPARGPNGPMELPAGVTPGWVPGSARLPAGSLPQKETAFARGGYTVQDGSGILVGSLAPEVRGRVLDLCAAPGTKTGHLLERGGDDVRILGVDRSRGRLRRMRRGIARLGRERQVTLVAADGRFSAWSHGFDGVLVDAPCTNLGVIRRRVDVRWRIEPGEIERLRRMQSELLDGAAAGVAPGGWLVYSVCTIEPEETVAQRRAFLERHRGWSPVALPGWVPDGARGEPGEVVLLPGEFETDGGYAFVLRKDAP